MAAVNLKVKVHPVVLLQIADSYERRSQDNHRVIGTLVGNVDKQSVEVTNCFCIPHKEYEERVEADIVYAQDMYELNRKVAPHETLVGWFATGSEITSHSALIHDYYARETKDPIHLTLDTTLTSGRVTMKAYVFVPLGVPGATSGSMFTPVQVNFFSWAIEHTVYCPKCGSNKNWEQCNLFSGWASGLWARNRRAGFVEQDQVLQGDQLLILLISYHAVVLTFL